VSNQLYNQIKDTCPEQMLKIGPLSAECEKLVEQMETAIGGVFTYNLYDEVPSLTSISHFSLC
jgi:hypothetical protein